MSSLLDELFFFVGAPIVLAVLWWIVTDRRKGLTAGLKDDLHR